MDELAPQESQRSQLEASRQSPPNLVPWREAKPLFKTAWGILVVLTVVAASFPLWSRMVLGSASTSANYLVPEWSMWSQAIVCAIGAVFLFSCYFVGSKHRAEAEGLPASERRDLGFIFLGLALTLWAVMSFAHNWLKDPVVRAILSSFNNAMFVTSVVFFDYQPAWLRKYKSKPGTWAVFGIVLVVWIFLEIGANRWGEEYVKAVDLPFSCATLLLVFYALMLSFVERAFPYLFYLSIVTFALLLASQLVEYGAIRQLLVEQDLNVLVECPKDLHVAGQCFRVDQDVLIPTLKLAAKAGVAFLFLALGVTWASDRWKDAADRKCKECKEEAKNAADRKCKECERVLPPADGAVSSATLVKVDGPTPTETATPVGGSPGLERIEFKGRGDRRSFLVDVDGSLVTLPKAEYRLALELALRRHLYGDGEDAFVPTETPQGTKLYLFSDLAGFFSKQARCKILSDDRIGDKQRRMNCHPSAVVIDPKAHRSLGEKVLSNDILRLLDELATRQTSSAANPSM